MRSGISQREMQQIALHLDQPRGIPGSYQKLQAKPLGVARLGRAVPPHARPLPPSAATPSRGQHRRYLDHCNGRAALAIETRNQPYSALGQSRKHTFCWADAGETELRSFTSKTPHLLPGRSHKRSHHCCAIASSFSRSPSCSPSNFAVGSFLVWNNYSSYSWGSASMVYSGQLESLAAW